jgi:hypothetical protein
MRWPWIGNNLNILCKKVNKTVLWIRYQWRSFVSVWKFHVINCNEVLRKSVFITIAAGGWGRFTSPAAAFMLSSTLMPLPSNSVLGYEAVGMWSLPPTSPGTPDGSVWYRWYVTHNKKKAAFLLKSVGTCTEYIECIKIVWIFRVLLLPYCERATIEERLHMRVYYDTTCR